MSELKTDADVVVSGCVASPSSSSLDTMDDSKENEAGGSLSTSSLKRKRSGPESPGPDIVVQDGSHATTHSDQKGKNKVLDVEPKPRKPKEELLGSYSCPICFSPPSNATLTPCGHICCGPCLFAAVKTTMQRASTMMAREEAIPRCPVCRATIPGWDGKGGGVIGLKARAILTL